MLGLFNSFDDEYLELYEYLTQDWEMKPEYAKPFLDTYKRSIGKIFSKGKKRMNMLNNNSTPELRLMSIANGDQTHSYALVGQAYQAYMTDLRQGKHIGTPIEKAIWAILVNRTDLVENLDRGFSTYISNKYEEIFPNLFEDVFLDNE